MKILLLTCFFSITLMSLRAQQNNSVVIGKIDSINSKFINEQRKIWIHVPESARDVHSKKKYPVIYLLDGDWNFTGVVGMIDLLGSINGNTYCPEMIVVGIPNTDRLRDLTPTYVTDGLWIDSSTSRRSGGGEAFMSFLEKELIPHIDSLYPTTPYRMLIGHSLGGLTVINTLVHHKTLFRSYVAIDPSMWWDRQRLLRETGQILQTTSYAGISLFLGMANTLPRGMDTATVQSDTSDGTIHPRSILQLRRYLMGNSQNGLQANYKYYNEDTHSSVPLIATYDALHFIFKDYQLILQDSYFADSTFKFTSFLKEHYENITLKYGITSEEGRTLLPPEGLVSGLGYQLLYKKQFTRAEELFKLNVNNYPESLEVYDALGDLYTTRGDKANAIASYKKSLSLKETAETKKKLENLEGK
ncbi:alpha/beta hydrolase-fold protein [Flavitalea flava]